MESALALPNDNIIVAAVETLCFWTFVCKNIGIDRPASGNPKLARQSNNQEHRRCEYLQANERVLADVSYRNS